MDSGMMFKTKSTDFMSWACWAYLATASALPVDPLNPSPGRSTLPMIMPMARAKVETTSKYISARMPTRPTCLASSIWAMPDTTVQKIIGAIIILINLIKPSPMALIQSLVAISGYSQPKMAPSTIPIST